MSRIFPSLSRGALLPGLVIAVLWSLSPAAAQDPVLTPPAAPAPVGMTADDVSARLKALENDTELDAAIKARLVDAYGKALASLKSAADSAARAESFARRGGEAAEQLTSTTAELAAPSAAKPSEIAADASVSQLQQQLTQAESQSAEFAKALKDLHDEPKRRADRRIEIPKLVEAARQQIAEVDRQLEAKPPAGESAEVSAASRLQLESRRKALDAEISAYQQELQFYESTAELLPAQRDLATRRAADAEQAAKTLRSAVNERRRAEAAQQARDAHRAALQADPAIRRIADENAALALQRQTLAAEIEKAGRELETLDQTVDSLEKQFEKITTRVEKVGETDAIGLLLRKQRSELPNVSRHADRIRARADDISDTYLKLMDYEENRDALATLDPWLRKIMAELDRSVVENDEAGLEKEIREMLQTQRSLFDSLISDTNSYLDKLVELDTREQELIEKTEEHAAYCDERILWIRSTSMLGVGQLQQLVASAVSIIDSGRWRTVLSAFAADLQKHLLVLGLLAVVLLTALKVRPRLVERMQELSEEASRNFSASIVPTLRASLITLVFGSFWPILMAVVGLRLVNASPLFDTVRAIGQGLLTGALVFATLELFLQVCRPKGLAESHFGWSVVAIREVRRSLRWITLALLPLLIIVVTAEALPGEVATNTIGRLAFLGAMATSAWGAFLLTRPGGGFFDLAATASDNGWSARLRSLLHVISVGTPIGLGVLAFSGYYYTALEFGWRALATLWIALGLFVIHAFLMRWVLLAYRDLAIRRAREKRVADAAASASPIPTAPVPAMEIKLTDINANTKKLLQLALYGGLAVGIWLIWSNVLPALGALRRVELWSVETIAAVGSSEAVLRAITLADLLTAVVIVLVTASMSRNVPSFLEITILKRLPIDAGARYAVSTICRYLITATGIILAFEAIGLGWGKVQWLVAAISVGLGFGLQEIFANFVSGLVLLFERPIRPGDIVTVGDVTGKVTRIQMRATTITDWDMRELIVPNKEFITSRVMNWTLTGTVSRMSVMIGVAPDADPDTVRTLLLQVARDNQLVLNDPPPHALLDDIGPGRLNFVLRVYMPSRDVFLQLRHELLTEIAHKFRAAAIEIALPQLEMHLRPEEQDMVTRFVES